VVTQHQQIVIKTSTVKSWQGRDRDAEGVTSGKADAFPTHIQTEH
jgi:hypothetical protein